MGSGFMTQAIASLRANRRLLQRKNNRFRQIKTPKTVKKNTGKKEDNADVWRLKLANRKRQNKIWTQLGILTILTILGTVLLLEKVNFFIEKQLIIHQNEVKNIEMTAISKSEKEGYFTLVKLGNYHLTHNDWQGAQDSFTKALNLFPNGKRANLGLTKSLIFQCKYKQKYCEEAISYFNKLGSLNIYSDEVIKGLSASITNIEK